MRNGARSLRRQAITESAVIFPVFGIFGGDVFDSHRKARGVRLHFDAMGVAGHGRVGPNLHAGPVGTDSGE